MRTGREALAKKAGKFFDEALKIHGAKGEVMMMLSMM